ncbi:hypothetical protein HAX54_003783, partial [Datura stramonium]|nr:hypothetical protein [Datura stramonium]
LKKSYYITCMTRTLAGSLAVEVVVLLLPSPAVERKERGGRWCEVTGKRKNRGRSGDDNGGFSGVVSVVYRSWWLEFEEERKGGALVVGEKRKARAVVYLDGVPAAGRSEKRGEEGRPLAGNYGGGVVTVRESEGERYGGRWWSRRRRDREERKRCG